MGNIIKRRAGVFLVGAVAAAADVGGAPVITRQPISASPTLGGSAAFSISAAGTGTLSYQWRFRGENVDGETNAILRLRSAGLQNLGEYSVVASDSTGSIGSDKVTLSLYVTVPAAFDPGLTAAVTETNLALDWRGEGIVQTAPNADGPWTAVGAVRKNHYSVPSGNPTAFYRLRNPHPRQVRVYLPSSYRPDSKAPLLIFLHGYNGDAATYEAYMGLQSVAESLGTIYCLPEGVVDSMGSRFWNAWQVCCDFKGSEVNDLMFLRELIRAIARDYSVASDRIFLAGHSNGAFMSFRFAMEYPDLVAAVAGISGTMDQITTVPAPSAHVNILQIHGTSDEIVAYAGGKVAGGFPITGTYVGARDFLNRWARWNGCAEIAPASTEPTLDLDRAVPGLDTVVWRSACPSAATVEHWEIVNAAHAPDWSAGFTRRMVQWLLDHPK